MSIPAKTIKVASVCRVCNVEVQGKAHFCDSCAVFRTVHKSKYKKYVAQQKSVKEKSFVITRLNEGFSEYDNKPYAEMETDVLLAMAAVVLPTFSRSRLLTIIKKALMQETSAVNVAFNGSDVALLDAVPEMDTKCATAKEKEDGKCSMDGYDDAELSVARPSKVKTSRAKRKMGIE